MDEMVRMPEESAVRIDKYYPKNATGRKIEIMSVDAEEKIMNNINNAPILVPEISDQEWVDRFVTGYCQSFDKETLVDANDAIARIFAKYNVAESI